MRQPTPNPGILEIAPYVAGKSKAAPGITPIKLSSNENPLGPSPLAITAYNNASATLHRYPDPMSARLREAIGEVEKLDPARIISGAGSDELIGLLVHAYAAAGDEIIISEHGFLMYEIYTRAVGATPVFVPEKNLTADVDALLAAVTANTKILFLANPNNPTGSYLSKLELHDLRTRLPSQVILAIDDAYSEYATAENYSDGRELVDLSANTVMLRTFSKIYGLPALRLGWGYFPVEIADAINRIRGPFNVSNPAMEAGIAAIKDVAYTNKARDHNTHWREWLTEALRILNLQVYPSQGNFVLVEFAREGKFTAQAVNQILLAKGIIVREVGNYKLPHHLRITIGTEVENKTLVAALTEYWRE